MKITKEDFDSLYSDNITKKDYDDIVAKIDNRFTEIVFFMTQGKRKSHHWFDYGNGDSGAGIDGHFNIHRYDECIEIDGNMPIPEPYRYDEGIPTRWLYEDFEEEFKKEVEDYKVEKETKKQKAQESKEQLKIKKDAMKEQIKAKLTKEELKFIKFK